MRIYVDFDGTVVEQVTDPYRTHYYIAEGCLSVLEKLSKNHTLILNTARADHNNGTLQIAIDFISDYIKFHEVNALKLSPPPYATIFSTPIPECMFIDDASDGVPMIEARYEGGKVVDWNRILQDLISIGFPL